MRVCVCSCHKHTTHTLTLADCGTRNCFIVQGEMQKTLWIALCELKINLQLAAAFAVTPHTHTSTHTTQIFKVTFLMQLLSFLFFLLLHFLVVFPDVFPAAVLWVVACVAQHAIIMAPLHGL